MAHTADLPTEGCETRVLAPEVPCATHNVAVLNIYNQIYRIAQELTRNQTSRVTAFSADDKERMDAYWAKLAELINICGDTIMDYHWLVEWKLAPMISTLPPVENDVINSVLAYLLGADMNLRVSQSTRLNDGLLTQDKNDLVQAVEKSKNLLDTMYANYNPHDMPQSSPSQAVVLPTSG